MGEKQLLNRKTYKDIKKFDRQQMDDYFKIVYEDGFKVGFQEGVKSSKQADFKIELVQLLEGIKGVGKRTKEKILEAYKERVKVQDEINL